MNSRARENALGDDTLVDAYVMALKEGNLSGSKIRGQFRTFFPSLKLLFCPENASALDTKVFF